MSTMSDEIDPEFEALASAVGQTMPGQSEGVVNTFAQRLFDQGVRKTVPLGSDPLDNAALFEEMLPKFEAILSDPPNQMTLEEALEEVAPQAQEERNVRLKERVALARQAPYNPEHHMEIDRLLAESGW